MIVKCLQEIIDDVQPENTFYTLETMPWMYPDSPDSYLELIKTIDRKAFAVHFDVVNLINCPQRSFENSDLIKEFTTKLGKYIKSCHAKDSLLHKTLTVRLDEARPGEGNVDYSTLLTELENLSPDMTLMIEHLPNEEEFKLAGDYIRKIAKLNNIIIK
jgi:L-ribulose-5-phosphate 3-epimerase UlaE